MLGLRMPRRRDMTGLEKLAYTILIAVVIADAALIALGRPDDGAARPGTNPAESTAGNPGTQPPPCSKASAGDGDEPVTCRTRSAILTIVSGRDPVLLGATQARLLTVRLAGSAVEARLRIRNESPAEQSVLAGGQEIYVNISGLRVDAARLRDDVRVQPGSGRTVHLRFPLTAARLAALRRQRGRAELGVKPWDEQTSEAHRGVIRFAVRTRAARRSQAPAVG
jgi:hypothetical protein